jgi:hypothetical protein
MVTAGRDLAIKDAISPAEPLPAARVSASANACRMRSRSDGRNSSLNLRAAMMSSLLSRSFMTPSEA